MQWCVLSLAAASYSAWNLGISFWVQTCLPYGVTLCPGLALVGFDSSSMPVSVCDVFIFRTESKQSHMENDTNIYPIWKKFSLCWWGPDMVISVMFVQYIVE